MQCDGGNWAQTVFRDCEMGGMDWGSADRGGMMIRFGERKPIIKALKGPWTRPPNEDYAVFTIDERRGLVVCEDKINGIFLFDIKTGRSSTSFQSKNSISFFSLGFSSFKNLRFYGVDHRYLGKKLSDAPFRYLNYGSHFPQIVYSNEIEITNMGYQNDSYAHFDLEGNLVDYDDEAADTWLFCLASGRPEPVETALPVD
jgi:hypothetical protein